MTICPICKSENIKEGYISTSAICWAPTGHSLMHLKKTVEEGQFSGFRLGKHHIFDEKKQLAFFCPDCINIIIPCDELRK